MKKRAFFTITCALVFVICVVLGSKVASISKASSDTSVDDEKKVETLKTSSDENVLIDEEGFNIELDYGYNGAVKIGNYLKLDIYIKYNDSFNGYVYAGIPDSSGGTIYRQSMELTNDEEQEIIMYVPVNVSSDTMLFEIVDEDEDILIKKNIGLTVYDNDTTIVGIISNEPKDVEYIQSDTSNITIEYDAKNLPKDYRELDSMDVLIINKFTTTRFTDEEYEAIKSWVKLGGTLLLGTGEYANNVLTRFKGDLFDYTIGQTQQQEISFNQTGSDNNKDKEVIKKKVADIVIDGGISISTGDSTTLFQYILKGKGKVLVAGFNLAIDEKNVSIQSQISSLVNNYSTSNSSGIYNDYLQSILQSTKANVPSITPCIVIIAGYFIILLFSYLILHIIRKKELLWIVIPSASIIMCIVMIISGTGSRISRAHSAYFSMTTLDGAKHAEENVYFNITSPNNNKYTLKLDDKYDIYSISLENNQNIEDESDEATFNTYISTKDDNTEIMFKDMEPFSTKVYSSSRNYDTEVSYESKISCTNNKYSGTFTNNTGFDLTNACMITSNSVIYIGNIDNGEQVNVEGLKSAVYHSKDRIYYSLYKLLGNKDDNTSLSVDGSGNITSVGLARALQYYALSSDFMNENGGYIFGVVNNDNNFVRGLKIDTEGIDTIAMNIDISYISGKNQYDQNISNELNFLSGDYYYSTLTGGVYISGNAEAEYSIGDKSTLVSLIYDHNMNVEYSETGKENEIVCDIYLWNYTKSKYDKVFISGVDKELKDFKDYISPYNKIKLKFANESESQISAPVLSVVKK